MRHHKSHSLATSRTWVRALGNKPANGRPLVPFVSCVMAHFRSGRAHGRSAEGPFFGFCRRVEFKSASIVWQGWPGCQHALPRGQSGPLWPDKARLTSGAGPHNAKGRSLLQEKQLGSALSAGPAVYLLAHCGPPESELVIYIYSSGEEK